MKKIICTSIKIILSLAFYVRIASSNDAFTSIHDIKQILRKEQVLIEQLDLSIEQEKARIRKIEQMRDSLKKKVAPITETSIDEYVGNPLNALYTIRRFNKDWEKVKDELNNEGFNKVWNDKPELLPTNQDQKGAIGGILRLQNFYKITAHNISKGILLNNDSEKKPEEMDLGLICTIGDESFKQEDWFLMKEWLDLALERIGDSEERDGCKRMWIVDFLSYVEFKLNHFERALKLNYELLAKYYPNEKRITDNIENMKSLIKDGSNKPLVKPNDNNYKKLCRGENLRNMTQDEELQMVCWYKNDQPKLRYKPQKVERLWARPEVLMFRELLNDEQIGTLINLSLQKLQRAGLHAETKDQKQYDDSRTSKHAWLYPKDIPLLKQMERRVQTMTNLDMRYAEPLQINNYGIGGHYHVHHDYAKKNIFEFGNRIATLMYYLSDVEAGGGTAFDLAKTTVFPSKGDAVFWWNLKQNGEGDEETRHAGCPVLMGQKWIANWWIHEHGQEFGRPCSLDKHL
ncbi:prolyl 4-hydroxylase subunit alpha-2-like [Clytia hemisphaerica]